MAPTIIPERKSVSQPFLGGLCPTKRAVVPFQHFGSCSYLVCFQFLSNSSFSYQSFQFQTSILQGEHQQRMKRQPTPQNPAGNPGSLFPFSGRVNRVNFGNLRHESARISCLSAGASWWWEDKKQHREKSFPFELAEAAMKIQVPGIWRI